MDITTTLHELTHSPLFKSVEGFLLPLAAIALVAIVALALVIRRAHMNSPRTARKAYMRQMGVNSRNYGQRVRSAQFELEAARRNWRAAQEYPLTMAAARQRLRTAENKLGTLRGFAA